MSRNLRKWLASAALALTLALAAAPAARAQAVFDGWSSEYGSGAGIGFGGFGGAGCGDCGGEPFCCQKHHCPPPLWHCQEGAPKIRVKCGCPKPICNPCTQPNWGYYEKCWSPWRWEPSYNHCWTMPPAATVALTGPDGKPNPYYQPPTQAPLRNVPGGVVPNMPSPAAPSVPQTPVMPRLAPNPTGLQPGFQPPNPQQVPPGGPVPQPIPGGGIESLPLPRSDVPRGFPPSGQY